MDIKQPIIDSVTNVMSNFGLSPKYVLESEESYLSSGNQVSILIGLANGLKGNIVIGLKRATALKMVSAMMGGKSVTQFGEMEKSALSEMAIMLIGTTLAKIDTKLAIESSPPTIVTGENMFIVVSRVKSKKILFKLDADFFNMAFCIEE